MVHHVRLDNGLRVVVTRTASPLAAVYLWVGSGTADEEAGEEGAAHLLEHMLFKGTPSRGVGVAAGEIEGLGGDLNAFTTHDETVLHATVEAEAWETALDVVVDMARNALLDPDELERERQVVLEELRGYEDEPDSVLEQAVRERLYPKHPYGRNILGTLASVGGMGRDALLAYWRRAYVADRVVLAVAGDVPVEDVVRLAGERLGDWNGVAAPRTRPPLPPSRPGPVHLDRPFETSAVELAFPTVSLGHPDAAALDVLSAALGEGQASVLTHYLQQEEGVASDVWAVLSLRPVGGHLSVGFEPREGMCARAVDLALGEIARIGRRGLSGTAVARAREAILADFLFGAETVDGLAHDLGWYTSRFGDPAAREAFRARVAAVTPDDVRRVAARYLAPEQATVAVLDRKVKAAALKKAVTRSRMTGSSPRRGPVRKRLKNGVRLLVLPDDAPVVAVRAVAIGGALAESSRTAGLVRAWSQMLTAGAGDLDPSALAERIDDVVGEVDGMGGRSALGIRGTFPAPHGADGLDVFGACLTEPWFDRDEWARVQEELLDDVRTLPDRAGEVAHQELWARLFPGHPWRLPASGTASTLGRIGPSTLRRLHEDVWRGANTVVAVAGGIDPDEAADVLEPWLETLEGGDARLPRRSRPGPERTREAVLRAGREQSTVLLGTRGASFADPDRLPLEVLAALLGGQGGRLFLSLREEKGLAYQVWAESTDGLDAGVFSVGLSTEPGRAAEAMAALRAELDRLAASPPSDDEVARYRRMLAGHSAMTLQRAAGRASDAAVGERFQLPWGLDAHRRALGAVTAADVARVTKRLLGRPWVPIVVHPRA